MKDKYLDFKAIELKDRALLQQLLYKYGENSCQHSFASMYCMADKYGDSYCIEDNWLFLYRAGLETDTYRTYLAPMGDSGEGDCSYAVQRLKADARYYGKKVRFESVTRAAAERMKESLGENYVICQKRDLSEYLYTYTKLTELPGHSLASKRTDINRFYRVYGNQIRIELLKEEHVPAVMEFQRQWLNSRIGDANERYLLHEERAIERALADYTTIGLSGIVIFLDNQVCGYAFGADISENCYDVMIEKGNREVKDIYRILNKELVKRCCQGKTYINREEDLGDEGLRKSKLSYYPDILLEKYVIFER